MRVRAALLLAAFGAALAGAPAAAHAASDPVDVLVYSATYGYRHTSIDTGKVQFAGLGAGDEFDVTLTEDPADINAAALRRFDVLVFLNATGNHPFSERQKRDVLDFLAAGKGVVTTHASIDGNYSWSDYGDITGAYFHSHPHTGIAQNVIEDRGNPLVAHLPPRFDHNDEYYRFQLDPRPNVHVLASLEKSTMGGNGTTYVDRQPVTWCQRIGGGRSYTTAWGHFDEVFTDVHSWTAIVQGVRWAAGRLPGVDCSTRGVRSRLQAEDADVIGGAEKQSSPFDGANQVVSSIQHDGYLLYRDLDLTDVRTVKVAAAPETAPTPSPYSLPQSKPAAGGTVSVVLDDLRYDNQALGGSGASYKVAGSAELSPARKPTTPLDGAAAGNPAGYDALEIPIKARGRHDVYVVFTNGRVSSFNPARVFAPAVQESMLLGSADWVEFPGLRFPAAAAPGAPASPGSTPAPAGTRRDRFAHVKLPRRLSVKRSRITLRFRRGTFPRGTRLAATLTGARKAKLASGRKTVRSGTTKVTLRLTARARRQLRRSRRLTGRLALRITTPDGARATKSRRVTITRGR